MGPLNIKRSVLNKRHSEILLDLKLETIRWLYILEFREKAETGNLNLKIIKMALQTQNWTRLLRE